MSKFLTTSVVCMAAGLYSASASAALFGLVPDGVQLGLGVSGTSGLNAFVGYANKNLDSFWWKRLGFRIDFANTSPVKSKINSEINSIIDEEENGLEIAGDLHIKNGGVSAKHFGALVDFYPFGNTWFLGGWRLSGGYFMGNLNVNADVYGTTTGGTYEFELGDYNYRYVGDDVRATAGAKWNYRGPYVGTGFDMGLLFGLKIYCDVGVVFTNKPAGLKLNVPTDGLEQLDGTEWKPVAGDATLEANLANAERDVLSDGQKELDKYKFYPMVKLGLMYRF